ncbi:hypothetical protein N7517_008188 [Penicillium concentricum]|uniref:mRNA stability protein n=1 Tax=Penicillium concentricum TaxID=293559 RepID=A0A9W9RRY9_9EURO|nr:uncharacterized protein N7517_008188 [Penicillium concentricum]KAJ5365302.1 hypothetical protein N7517_008188 [Penicillium concentricum]
MQSGGKGPDLEPLSESDKRNIRKYGKLPRGGLLAQQSKERTYFDSGDFALSAADRITDNGAIKTGRAHPRRDSISHPYAPIPAASNVNKDATEELYRKSVDPEKSPLLQEGNIADEEPANEEEGHGNSISHEG